MFYMDKNTHNLSLNNIIQHTLSVKLGTKRSLLVVDMPKGTYKTAKIAEKNAKLILRKTKCDAVKIESNKKNFKIINNLVSNKIPVMGHIGYTPQFKKKFKIEGTNKKEIEKLVNEALLIQKAGACSIVLECLSPFAAKIITKALTIPTIGIGSSSYCDGQILVTDDILGIWFLSKICKKICKFK